MSAVNSISDFMSHEINWDFEGKHVSQSFADAQNNIKPTTVSDVIDSGTVLLAAAPASLDEAVAINPNGIRIVPIGMIESVSVQLGRQLSRIFEIGSKIGYIIPGRTVGDMSINRVLFDGDNLLKVLYGGELAADGAGVLYKYAQFSSDTSGPGTTRRFAHISSGHIAMNLASTFFNQPCGLVLYFKDQQSDLVSELYFEGVHIGSYSFGMSAGANVLVESAQLSFIQVRPIVTVDSNVNDPDQLSDSNIVGGSENWTML